MIADAATNKVLFEFETPAATAGWATVNDDVMGGVSTSSFTWGEGGSAEFKGNLSLDNNGGFASVRTTSQLPEIKGSIAFVVRVRGDGRTYRFTARMSNAWNSPTYQAEFETTAGEWLDVELPLRAFKASFRGRPLPNEPPLDASRINVIGVLLGDKKPGPFRLEVRRISVTQTQR
jgi:monofunctional biosynthetic peptidoglycan transglycosylase